MPGTDQGLTFCEALPEFTTLSEDDVWRTILSDDLGETAISGELRRLVAAFLCAVKSYVDSRGNEAVCGLIEVEVHCAIERIAVQMLIQYVELRVGSRLHIK